MALAGCSVIWLLAGLILGGQSPFSFSETNRAFLGGVAGGVVGLPVLWALTRRRVKVSRGLAFLALWSGVFVPWIGISYFGVGRISAGVLDMPGGEVYVAGVAVFLLGAMCNESGHRSTRLALLVVAAGLAGYSGFWFLGQLILAVRSELSLAELSFGVGSLVSFVGAVFSGLGVRSSARREVVTSPSGDEEQDLVLTSSGPHSEFASRQAFLDRLGALLEGADGRDTVPLVFLRVDGLDQVRRRFGGPASDRILLTMAHRLRANVRHNDIVVRLVPAEVFILLAGDLREEYIQVVVRRLSARLATTLPGVKRRHVKPVHVTVAAVQASVVNGRLRVTFDENYLLDAPIRAEEIASAVGDVSSDPANILGPSATGPDPSSCHSLPLLLASQPRVTGTGEDRGGEDAVMKAEAKDEITRQRQARWLP